MKIPFQLPQRRNPRFKSLYDFDTYNKLGYGALSSVYRALDRKSNTVYALKIVDLTKISRLDKENVEKEVEAHSKLSHPNIVELIDFFREKDKIYLVLEFCPGNTLFRYVANGGGVSEKESRSILRQVAKGLGYMHNKGYTHRDLKPENVLKGSDGEWKICDFGWASHRSDLAYSKLRAGTMAYMSPESLLGRYQAEASDMWALGVMLYELLYDIEPYQGTSIKDQLNRVKQDKPNFSARRISEPAKRLILSLLRLDPAKRPKIDQLFNSEFIQGNGFSDKKQKLNRPQISRPLKKSGEKVKSSISKLNVRNWNSKVKPIKKTAESIGKSDLSYKFRKAKPSPFELKNGYLPRTREQHKNENYMVKPIFNREMSTDVYMYQSNQRENRVGTYHSFAVPSNLQQDNRNVRIPLMTNVSRNSSVSRRYISSSSRHMPEVKLHNTYNNTLTRNYSSREISIPNRSYNQKRNSHSLAFASQQNIQSFTDNQISDRLNHNVYKTPQRIEYGQYVGNVYRTNSVSNQTNLNSYKLVEPISRTNVYSFLSRANVRAPHLNK